MAQQLLKANPSYSSKFWKTLFSILERPFSVPIHNSPLESKNKDRMALLGSPSTVVKFLEGYCCACVLGMIKAARQQRKRMNLVRKIFLEIFHFSTGTGNFFSTLENQIIVFLVNSEDLFDIDDRPMVDADKLLRGKRFFYGP